MIEKLFPGFYRIEIPLPDSPLKSLNSYVITGSTRNLIIDTGLNRTACEKAMMAGLREIGITMADTDIFITHLHADHFGLVSKLATKNTTVYFNRPDAELIESFEGFDPMIEYAGVNGFPRAELRSALEQHPGFKHGSAWMPELKILDNRETIRAGDYSFQCIHTPGHTMGHMCLYEPEQKILVSGDHILIDITPNIQCWSDNENPLKAYLASLEAVRSLDVKMVLPGHRRLFSDHAARIDELTQHHLKRLDEIRTIMRKNGSQTAYQAASRMTWDIRCDRWEDFPVAQKWFATGEAISHLRYLEEAGEFSRHTSEKMTFYSENK
jgi:glyoxylase-like metal-dependent hydrolase (beta-lactamase superfamily II)